MWPELWTTTIFPPRTFVAPRNSKDGPPCGSVNPGITSDNRRLLASDQDVGVDEPDVDPKGFGWPEVLSVGDPDREVAAADGNAHPLRPRPKLSSLQTAKLPHATRANHVRRLIC